MSSDTDTDEEIEEDRKRALADFENLIQADFLPGSYGCHEALHTAHLMTDIVERHLLTHPAILLNADWYRRAHRAVHEIGTLYQEIGSAEPAKRK